MNHLVWTGYNFLTIFYSFGRISIEICWASNFHDKNDSQKEKDLLMKKSILLKKNYSSLIIWNIWTTFSSNIYFVMMNSRNEIVLLNPFTKSGVQPHNSFSILEILCSLFCRQYVYLWKIMLKFANRVCIYQWHSSILSSLLTVKNLYLSTRDLASIK